jgi:hypothetical protein
MSRVVAVGPVARYLVLFYNRILLADGFPNNSSVSSLRKMRILILKHEDITVSRRHLCDLFSARPSRGAVDIKRAVGRLQLEAVIPDPYVVSILGKDDGVGYPYIG